MKRKANTGVSTVISEMLILSMVIILAAAFVVSLQSHVSYYVKSKELTSMCIWTVTKNGFMNFTAIHAGGDPTTIRGHIYIEHEDGTTSPLEAKLTYNSISSIITGEFELTAVKFGEQIQISVNLTTLTNGTIHYILNSKSQILAEVEVKN